MSEEPKENTSAPFMRIVTGRHSQLLGEREILLADLQVIDETKPDRFSERVISKLDDLANLDLKIDTLKRYFSQPESEED